jgi:SAM-dependent methyltransferase
MKKHFGYSYRNPLYVIKSTLWKKLAEVLPNLQGRVLDCGAGTQPYAGLLSKDVSYVSMDYNTQLKPKLIGDIRFLPFRDNLFGGIILTEVLEHIYETDLVLQEIARVAESGTTIVCSTPFNWGLHYQPYDYYRFTPFALEKLFVNNGFSVIKIHRLGGVFTASYQRLLDVLYSWLLSKLSRNQKGSPGFLERTLKYLIITPNAFAGMLLPRLDKISENDAMTFLLIARKD